MRPELDWLSERRQELSSRWHHCVSRYRSWAGSRGASPRPHQETRRWASTLQTWPAQTVSQPSYHQKPNIKKKTHDETKKNRVKTQDTIEINHQTETNSIRKSYLPGLWSEVSWGASFHTKRGKKKSSLTAAMEEKTPSTAQGEATEQQKPSPSPQINQQKVLKNAQKKTGSDLLLAN